jgi:2-keto-4-pentenoate hydratase
MNISIVNRKYLIGNKWIRLEKMKGVRLVGYKLALGIYEIRLYF